MLTISRLATASGTSVATIKFYLREGLVPRGDPAAPARAFYGGSHVERLVLIRVLRTLGGLGIPAIRALCAVIDRRDARLEDVACRTMDALGSQTSRPHGSATDRARAQRDVRTFLRSRQIDVRPKSRAVADLADALASLRRVVPGVSVEALAPYLDAMLALAERDVAQTRQLVTGAAEAAYAATLSLVLWEPLLLILRRISLEHAVRSR